MDMIEHITLGLFSFQTSAVSTGLGLCESGAGTDRESLCGAACGCDGAYQVTFNKPQ